MNGNPEENPPSNEQPAENPESAAKSKEAKESNPPKTLEEFIKNFTGSDSSKSISEFLQGLGAANVFIDARSGGAYFTDRVDITGDVVGVNQTKWTRVSAKRSSVKEVAGQVLSADIEKVRSVYVETASYTQAKSILSEKHVLILCGDSNYGKQTTAIHLLAILTAEEIFEINPTVEDLSSFQCESAQMYVIDTLAPDSAEKLNSYVLNSLSQKLREQQSYLVIT